MNFHKPSQVMLAALRDELLSLLSQCTDEQQENFGRIFPNGIDNLSEGKLKDAILLCQRTLKNNAEKAQQAAV